MTQALSPPAVPTVPPYPALGSANFNQEAWTYATSMPGVSAGLQALAANVAGNTNIAHDNATAASTSAGNAALSAALAAQSVTDAAAAAGATKWASGQTYAQGAVVWSPANGLNYRRKAAGAGAIDPSADPANWWLLGAPQALPIQIISANTQAQANTHYVLTAACTLTLPASPAVRDVVQVTDLSDSLGVVIDPNGAPVRGEYGALILNVQRVRAAFIYSGSTKGWV